MITIEQAREISTKSMTPYYKTECHSAVYDMLKEFDNLKLIRYKSTNHKEIFYIKDVNLEGIERVVYIIQINFDSATNPSRPTIYTAEYIKTFNNKGNIKIGFNRMDELRTFTDLVNKMIRKNDSEE